MDDKKPDKKGARKDTGSAPETEKNIDPQTGEAAPAEPETIKEKLKKRALQLSTLLFVLFALTLILGSILSTQDFICGACHAVAADRESLARSAHSKISCFACHNERGYLSPLTIRVNAARNFLKALTGAYEMPLNARVDIYRCLYCHPSILEKVNESSSIRVSHYEFTRAGYNCAECHSDTAHPIEGIVRTSPNMDRCLTCHNNKQASGGCTLCHLDNVWRKTTLSLASPFQIAHAPGQERRLHGMLDQQACTVCHSNQFCFRCHKSKLPHEEDWLSYHGILAGKSRNDCYTCHNAKYCNTCHQIPMPHPQGFIIEHGRSAEKVGELICLNCHVKETCNFCHIKSVHRYLGGKYKVKNGHVYRKIYDM